jgi:DNA-binding SARP family transcriptional activator/tetratricopeptide (TPR) repeat protein
VGASVVVSMETWSTREAATESGLHIRLLGALTVRNGEETVNLPASRKVRALLAFLVLAPGATTRSRLCELLWDGPGDPRGELRWSLCKVRSILDGPRRRVLTRDDSVSLDLSDCCVDALRISRAMREDPGKLQVSQLRKLEALFAGELAEGLELDREPGFSSWLSAQRREFKAFHLALLEQLTDADPEHAFTYLEQRVQLTPFDTRAHQELLRALLESGRVREGEQHLERTIRLFQTEGLEWLPIRESWKAARLRVQVQPKASVEIMTAPAPKIAESARSERSSICVMPIVDRSAGGIVRGGVADALTDEIITRLAKLRMLFVIARGTAYALGERQIPADEAGRLLNVDYVASGSLRRHGGRIAVTVELTDVRSSRIVWVDDLGFADEDAPAAPEEVSNRIVASMAEEIEVQERNRAMLKPPGSLTAWEAYHRGLWYMYRFNAEDNARASHFFQLAVSQDRTFARAYAGLSFTHFQNAFLLRPGDRQRETELAFEMAGESLVADDRDPAAHWAMGRALWLRGAEDESVNELQTCVSLSPNFALGHYTLGFVQGQARDARKALASTDYSHRLSPFDPLQFAMFAARAIALVRLGNFEEAAHWGVRGAVRPNSHVHTRAIAANCLAAAGRLDEARQFVDTIHKTHPRYTIEDFLGSFRFAPDTAALFRRHALQVGLAS